MSGDLASGLAEERVNGKGRRWLGTTHKLERRKSFFFRHPLLDALFCVSRIRNVDHLQRFLQPIKQQLYVWSVHWHRHVNCKAHTLQAGPSRQT